MILESTLEQLRNVSILQVAERYLPDGYRRESPGIYKASCPFHEDGQTPSLALYTKDNSFYCFSCGAGKGGSDVISFVMKAEGCDFRQAVEIISQISGIPIEEEKKDDPVFRAFEGLAHQNKRFVATLEKSVEAQAYLESRGVTREMWREWEMGFVSPDEPYYQTNARRLTFPIRDIQGRIRGWDFRSIDDSDPKSKTSPNSRLFNKQAVLPGIDRVSQKAKRIVVVEGLFDFLSMQRIGIRDSCYSLGGKLYPDQIELLRRRIDPDEGFVVLMYDSDPAGRRGAAQACIDLEKAGVRAKIFLLPDGMDPDDWAKQVNSPDAAEVELDKALPLIHHHVLAMERDMGAELHQLQLELNRRIMDISDRYRERMEKVLAIHSHNPNLAFYREWMSDMVTRPIEYIQKSLGVPDHSLAEGKEVLTKH